MNYPAYDRIKIKLPKDCSVTIQLNNLKESDIVDGALVLSPLFEGDMKNLESLLHFTNTKD